MMPLPQVTTLGALFGLSELTLSIFLRAKIGKQDQGSLRMIWLVVISCIFVAVYITFKLPQFQFVANRFSYPFGVALFFAGLSVRWYSIYYLGRFFTVNVAISEDHRVIDSGPYRYIRHPSYTGALMAFSGFALCLSNGLSVLIIVLPVSAVFLYRIRIEEAALHAGLGVAYNNYCKRTKRLIPAIY
jgi:protein-S-isoprenylcysteine O-methyltransferase